MLSVPRTELSGRVSGKKSYHWFENSLQHNIQIPMKLNTKLTFYTVQQMPLKPLNISIPHAIYDIALKWGSELQPGPISHLKNPGGLRDSHPESVTAADFTGSCADLEVFTDLEVFAMLQTPTGVKQPVLYAVQLTLQTRRSLQKAFH